MLGVDGSSELGEEPKLTSNSVLDFLPVELNYQRFLRNKFAALLSSSVTMMVHDPQVNRFFLSVLFLL